MAVPTAFADLSTTAASNPPAGGDAANLSDDNIRQIYAFIASLYAGSSNGQVVFPATQNASSNANTLDDYEEGTFTPTDASGAGLSLSAATGRYIKVGKIVHIQINVVYPTTASTANAKIGGLPFTSTGTSGIAVGYCGVTALTNASILDAATAVTLYNGASFVTNVELTGANVLLGGTYEASA